MMVVPQWQNSHEDYIKQIEGLTDSAYDPSSWARIIIREDLIKPI
jgi:hypothetical protein